jgi:twitching motility protein PilT
MREPETIATALTAAETGHLVLSTLHSPSHAGHRAHHRCLHDNTQKQVVLQLANTLQGIVAGTRARCGSQPAGKHELPAATNAIRNIIRETNCTRWKTVSRPAQRTAW